MGLMSISVVAICSGNERPPLLPLCISNDAPPPRSPAAPRPRPIDCGGARAGSAVIVTPSDTLPAPAKQTLSHARKAQFAPPRIGIERAEARYKFGGGP
ncbi:unnamed protein product, partial [Iphiclides podalirius]